MIYSRIPKLTLFVSANHLFWAYVLESSRLPLGFREIAFVDGVKRSVILIVHPRSIVEIYRLWAYSTHFSSHKDSYQMNILILN